MVYTQHKRYTHNTKDIFTTQKICSQYKRYIHKTKDIYTTQKI